MSRLFSRKQPDGLTDRSTAAEIFDAFAHAERSQSLYDENLKAIRGLLVSRHGFALSTKDWQEIEYAFDAFSTFGPRIHYLSTGTDSYGGSLLPTYAELMTATDADGIAHSYLNTEEGFRFMKDFESRNLLVPVVGEFRRAKSDSRRRQLSEGERRDGVGVLSIERRTVFLSGKYLGNLLPERGHAALPGSSVFIRSAFDGRYGRGSGLNQDVGPVLRRSSTAATRNSKPPVMSRFRSSCVARFSLV